MDAQLLPVIFPESQLTNDVRYGYNRALMAWYNIDPLFTRRSSSLTPAHIKSDLNQLSDPYIREVYKREIYPNKDLNYQEASTMEVLNVAFYPTERGPYNLDPNLNSQGRLSNPQSRWGGMMRRIETSDFQTANIEYIEFWLMDPFIHSRENGTDNSGDLYFNLGEISEDVLKDGKMFYESGLPIDGDPAYYTETVWGRVPNQSTVTYAFNTSSGSRQMQDVGYNGLSSSEEARFRHTRTISNKYKDVSAKPFTIPSTTIRQATSITTSAAPTTTVKSAPSSTATNISTIRMATLLTPTTLRNHTARPIKPRLTSTTSTKTTR